MGRQLMGKRRRRRRTVDDDENLYFSLAFTTTRGPSYSELLDSGLVPVAAPTTALSFTTCT
jgi:hypothetical protein